MGSGIQGPVLPINSSGNQVGNRQKLPHRLLLLIFLKIVEFKASKRVKVARSIAVPDAFMDM